MNVWHMKAACQQLLHEKRTAVRHLIHFVLLLCYPNLFVILLPVIQSEFLAVETLHVIVGVVGEPFELDVVCFRAQ